MSDIKFFLPLLFIIITQPALSWSSPININSIDNGINNITTNAIVDTATVATAIDATTVTKNDGYKILVVLPAKEISYGLSLDNVKPVIDIAAADVIKALILPKNFLHFNYFDSKYHIGSFIAERMVTVKTFKDYYSDNLNALLGFADSYTLATVAKVTAGLPDGLPIVTTAGRVSALGVKSEYPYLTRLMGSWDQLAAGVYKFLQIDKLTETSTLYNIGFFLHDPKRSPKAKKAAEQNEVSSDCYFAMHGIKQYFVDHNQKYREKWRRYIPTSIFDEQYLDSKTIQKLLKELTTISNTILLCGSPKTVRNVMKEAENLGLTTSGNFSFYNIDLGATPTASDNNDRMPQYSSGLQSLRTIGFRRFYDSKYYETEQRIRDRAENFYNYGAKYGKPYRTNDFIMSFYDAVMLYAKALNQSLASGQRIQDTSLLTKTMWNLNFNGIIGNVSFNERGDKKMQTVLSTYSPVRQRFTDVATYSDADDRLQIIDALLFKSTVPKISAANSAPAIPSVSLDTQSALDRRFNYEPKLVVIVVLALTMTVILIVAISRDRSQRAQLSKLRSGFDGKLLHQQFLDAEKDALMVWQKTSLANNPLIKLHVTNDSNC